jgi:hypothetical protein
MKVIVKNDPNFLHSALSCIDICLLKHQLPFVRYSASRLAAFCLFLQPKPSLDFLKRYKGNASHIVRRLSELQGDFASPKELFAFARECAPSAVDDLFPLFSDAGKQELIGTLLGERTPSIEQLSILQQLARGENDLHSCAGAALQLARSGDAGDRDFAAHVLSDIAQGCPRVGQPFLKSSVQLLLSDRNERSALANATATAAILRGNPQLADSVGDDLRSLAEAVLRLDIGSVRFTEIWSVLALLPEGFVPRNAIESALQTIRDAISRLPSDKPDHRYAGLLEHVLPFYGVWPQYPCADVIFSYANDIFDRLSERALGGYVDYILAVKKPCDPFLPKLIARAVTIFPGSRFLKAAIGRVLASADEVLGTKQGIGENFVSSRQEFCQKMIIKFPELIQGCSPDVRDSTVTDMLTIVAPSANQILVFHAMLLSGIRARIPLPKSVNGNLLKTLKGSDYLRIQLTCECIALQLEHDRALTDPLLRFIDMNKRQVSCLLFSAILSRLHVPQSYLSRGILFLNECLRWHATAPFALHAMETALETHPEDIADLQLAGQELSWLLKLVNGSTSLHPMVLFLQTSVFTKLLALTAHSTDFHPIILAIINAVKSTPYELGKGIVYNSVLALAKVAFPLAASIPLQPPAQTASLSCVVIAAETFAVVNRPWADLQRLIFAAHKIGDGRALEALRLVLLQQPIGTISGLLTNVFLNDRLSDQIPIQPGFHLKNVLLLVLGQALPAVTEAEASPIAVALCSAAASGYEELQLRAFSLLKILIDRFTLESLGGQFSQLTEIALGLDLSVTGGFLSSCLRGGNLRACLQPLLQVRNLTEEYFALTAKVIRGSANQRDCLAPFVDRLFLPFATMLTKVIKTRQPLEFKGLYRDLPAAFVIIQKLSDRLEIPIAPLFSFLSVELRATSDPVIAEADIAGATAILDCYPDDVEQPLVLELFSAAITHPILYTAEFRAAVVALSLRVARLPSLEESAWDSLLYTIATIGISPGAVARVLDHFPRERLSPHGPALALRAIREISAVRPPASLFRVLSAKANPAVLSSVVIQWADEAPGRSARAFRLLEALDGASPGVAQFARRRLRQGGLEFAVRLLRRGNLKVAAKIADAALGQALVDGTGAGRWLGLGQMVAEKVKRPEVNAVARAGLEIVARGGAGTETVAAAARALRAWRGTDEAGCRGAWEALGEGRGSVGWPHWQLCDKEVIVIVPPV